MHATLFYYTLIVMLFSACAACTAVSAFLVSHRRAFLYATAAMLAYFSDIALVFFDDFMAADATLYAISFWEIGDPIVLTVTGALTLLFIWLAICQCVGVKSLTARFFPTVAFVVLSMVTLNFVPDLRVKRFLYFTVREICMIGMACTMAIWYLSAGTSARRGIMRRYVKPYVAALVIILLIVAENAYFQLIFRPSSLGEVWFFAERNLAENILFVLIAGCIIHASARELRLRYENPPARDDAILEESITLIMPTYVQTYGLSPRESEVLHLILEGKDNQNIASELTLALATIKVHVHKILKKTGQSSRTHLIRDFWQS